MIRRKVRLAGAGRPDAHHDVVLGNGAQIIALALGLGQNRAPKPGQQDPALTWRGQLGRRNAVGGDPAHHLRRYRLSHPGEIDQALRDHRRPIHRLGRSAERERIPAQRRPNA
jgi:hypothetical protein